MGILRELNVQNDVLIVAKGWPSWFFALEGFKSHSIKIFLRASLSVKEEFKALAGNHPILKEDELEDWLGSSSGIKSLCGVAAQWLPSQ